MLKLQKEKCIFDVDKITYSRFRTAKNWFHPTKQKVQAIHKGQIPKTKTELRAFEGLRSNNKEAFIIIAIRSSIWDND